ncbi:MAG: DHHA1 domain-containing protein [Candidatus Nanoarchaeia archaeon]|nr:DHHA1 domain-containing protein [Candidatus Nanoarchaeia archaeon]
MKKDKFEEFKKFIEKLEGKIFLIYHFDVDGFCSAVLFQHALREKCKFVFVPSPPALPSFASELRKDIELENPEAIVFVDLQVDPKSDSYSGIKLKTLVMDHHKPPKDFDSKNFLHINTHFFSKKYYPASKLVYDYFTKAGYDLSKYKWVSGVGVIADKGGEEWKDFLDKIYAEKPELKTGDIYGFDCPLGDIGKRLSSAILYYGRTRANSVMDIMLDAENPEELLNSKDLDELNEKMQAKIRQSIESFEDDSESHGILSFCEVKNKRLKSITATILSMKEPNRIFILYSSSGGYVFFSMRHSSGRIDLSDMLKKILKKIPGSRGGGHPGATGGIFKKKHFEKFKNELISYVNKYEGE